MATLKITPLVAPVVIERDSSKTEKVYTPDMLNGTGVTLLKGSAVRMDPNSGSVVLASANSVPNSAVAGFLAEDTAAGQSERVVIAGVSAFILESGQAALSPGQLVYLSVTEPGRVTGAAPSSVGNVKIPLGRAHGNQIFIEVGTGILRS